MKSPSSPWLLKGNLKAKYLPAWFKWILRVSYIAFCLGISSKLCTVRILKAPKSPTSSDQPPHTLPMAPGPACGCQSQCQQHLVLAPTAPGKPTSPLSHSSAFIEIQNNKTFFFFFFSLTESFNIYMRFYFAYLLTISLYGVWQIETQEIVYRYHVPVWAFCAWMCVCTSHWYT